MDDLFGTALQLGIGGLSVAGIIYVSLQHSKMMKAMQDAFVHTLDQRSDKHESALRERESAMRGLEASVRAGLTEQLTKNTVALLDVAKLLGRVARHLDGEN